MKWKVGHSTRKLNEEMVFQYLENGIEALELGLPVPKDIFKKMSSYTDFASCVHDFSGELEQFKKLLDNSEIIPHSFHLAFHPAALNDPASLDVNVAKTTIDIQKLSLEKAAYLGCKIAVIHPSREPYPEEERAERIAAAQKVLAELADFAAKMNIQIAVENLPRTCLGRNSSEILELIQADDRLRVCYDTNHLLCEDAESFIKACGSKIITLHVSDYDFLDERHWMPGEGKNDWSKIYGLLREVGYNGPWLYELGFEGAESILRSRDLSYADFRRNADEIFEGKPLTVLGKPAQGLLRWEERDALRWSKK